VSAEDVCLLSRHSIIDHLYVSYRMYKRLSKWEKYINPSYMEQTVLFKVVIHSHSYIK
jgi:hypothetical protein